MGALHLEITTNPHVFLAGYTNFTVHRAGALNCAFPKLGERLAVGRDLAPLFPYLNNSVKGARYFDQPERVQCIFADVPCTLYSYEIIAAGFNDHDHARIFAENLLDFLNELHEKREAITPNHRKAKHLAALDIYKILPQTNCRKCSLPSCLAFAAALSKGKISSSQCPGFAKPMEEKAVYQIVDSAGRLTSTIELDLPEQELPIPHQQAELQSLLTERELQVLQLIAQGFTNPEISKQLFISPHTVKTHVGHLYEKIGVNDRAQAAVLAARHHLI